MTQYKLYDRISTTDNHIASIKYIGHIPQWGSQVTAYGLEWDDATRGKNNGQLDGITYFTTTVPNSASFIKSTNKIVTNCQRKSFVQVIKELYLDVDGYQAKGIKFGVKVVEEYGWQRLNEYQAQLQNLNSLSLDHLMVYCMCHDGDEGYVDDVFGGLCNLINLDLSCNLFKHMDDIWQIVSRLPKLQVLNINGNRFAPDVMNDRSIEAFTHSSVQVLKMASTLIPIHHVNSIIAQFPDLQELIISGNHYTDEDIKLLEFGKCKMIKSLDVSYNEIIRVPTNLAESILTLNVSHCRIGTIDKSDSTSNYTIESLDIRHNQLSTWSDIDNLSQTFPNLVNLRINHNPISESVSVDEMTCQLIGRFECDAENSNEASGERKLCVLNGSRLTLSEIENGELYFISKVEQGQYIIDNVTRWKSLLNKYGKSDNTNLSSSPPSQLKRWIDLVLNIRYNNIKEVPTESEAKVSTGRSTSIYTTLSTHKFLKSTSILKLKGTISRLYLSNLSILKFKIYYYVNQDTNFATLYEFDNLSNCLNNFALEDKQNIYIDVSA